MKRFITTALISLISFSPVQADELQIILGSKHYKSYDYDVNEINPGLVYSKTLNDSFSVIAGGYKNSYRKLTALVGVEYQYKYVGAQIGLGSGYKQLTGQTVSLIGSLFAQIPINDSFSARLSAIPHKDGALGLSFVVGLD